MTNLTHFLATGGVLGGAVAVLGITMQATVGDAAVPWDKIGNVGIVTVVVMVGGYFLRRENAIRSELGAQHAEQMKARDEVNKHIATTFAESTQTMTKTYVDKAAADEVRAQQRERQLQDLYERLTKDRS